MCMMLEEDDDALTRGWRVKRMCILCPECNGQIRT